MKGGVEKKDREESELEKERRGGESGNSVVKPYDPPSHFML